ncbi:MAG: zinc-dependent peptidase [Proteobacteria bacterium]|nr:zinc-dependent peptidase [Pseudomonadota bacterium]
MNGFDFFLIVLISVIVFIVTRHTYINYRRKRIIATPTDKTWLQILEQNLTVYKYLPHELKIQLHDLMKVFIAEKNFEGCGGLEMTEEIKVTVSAQACVLMLNRKPNFYPNLYSILVYPSSYFAKDIHHLSFGTYVISQSFRMGESWKAGIVVLAWDHVQRGALDMDDGHNVVYHEFAHQLDEEDERHADGVPVLRRPSSYVTWARVFSREFKKLRKDINKNNLTVIDEYGATNPAEFFAVATESFFEKPMQMKEKHPALYDALNGYYELDPVTWVINA